MKCLFCQDREATKKNTHYLTDAIIRSALNEGGSNEREKGVYFGFDSKKAGVDFNFQRAATREKLEEILGRPATDEEIEKSKSGIECSVDDHFCPTCEDHFTKIENLFIEELLPQFRDVDLSGVTEIKVENVRLFRSFFLLQVLRSALCSDSYSLASGVIDDLRSILTDFKNVAIGELTKYPLIVTYLSSQGGLEEKTEGQVGFVSDPDGQIILMNNFVVQFFASPAEVKRLDYRNLNPPDSFDRYLNIGEAEFKVRVMSDEERHVLMPGMFEAKLRDLANLFSDKFAARFGFEPAPHFFIDFVRRIASTDSEVPIGVRYANDRVVKIADTCLDEIEASFKRLK